MVTIAVRVARKCNQDADVGILELEGAYHHDDYTSHRDAVEILHGQAIEGRMRRKDLWCPLVNTQPARKRAGNVVPLDKVREEFERRVNDQILESVLGPIDEAATKPVPKPATADQTTKGSVVRLGRRKTTKEDLLAGAQALEDL